MKLLVNVILALFISFSAYGQWSVGPKVAYGTISQGEEKIRIIPNSDRIPMEMSFLGGNSVKSAGFMLYNNLGPGFLQVEALGTAYSLQYSSREYGSDATKLLNENHVIIELPVAAGFNVKNFKVGVGPVLEINVSKSSDLETIEEYEDTANPIDGGFQGLLGYKKGIFNIDLRYVYKFSGVVDGFGIGDDILKLNKSANRLSLSVGMTFGNQSGLTDTVEEAQEIINF